jgi:hypothetical protein
MRLLLKCKAAFLFIIFLRYFSPDEHVRIFAYENTGIPERGGYRLTLAGWQDDYAGPDGQLLVQCETDPNRFYFVVIGDTTGELRSADVTSILDKTRSQPEATPSSLP